MSADEAWWTCLPSDLAVKLSSMLNQVAERGSGWVLSGKEQSVWPQISCSLARRIAEMAAHRALNRCASQHYDFLREARAKGPLIGSSRSLTTAPSVGETAGCSSRAGLRHLVIYRHRGVMSGLLPHHRQLQTSHTGRAEPLRRSIQVNSRCCPSHTWWRDQLRC